MSAPQIAIGISFVFFYLLTVFLLRPFRIHRKRRFSTIGMKASYLLYFAVLQIFLYLMIFAEKDEAAGFATKSETYLSEFFLIFLAAAIIPNLGIIMRRKVKKKRSEYNLFMTAINVLFTLYIIVLLIVGEYSRF